MSQFKTVEEAKPVFVEGKRNALGTTQEVGLSTTFFANPFGPMQRQEIAMPLMIRCSINYLKRNLCR